MPPSLRSPPPEPEGRAGPRIPTRRASFSPRGPNPAPPLARGPTPPRTRPERSVPASPLPTHLPPSVPKETRNLPLPSAPPTPGGPVLPPRPSLGYATLTHPARPCREPPHRPRAGPRRPLGTAASGTKRAGRPGRGRRPCWRGRRTKACGLRPPPAARPAGGAVQAPPGQCAAARRSPDATAPQRAQRVPLAAPAPPRRTDLTCGPPRLLSAARGPHRPASRSRPDPARQRRPAPAPPPPPPPPPPARPRSHDARALRPPTALAAPPGPGPAGRTAQAPQAAGGAWCCSPGCRMGKARQSKAGPGGGETGPGGGEARPGGRRSEVWRCSPGGRASGAGLRGAGPGG